MDPKVFFDVVMPLVEVDSAVIIGISTPVSDTYNFFDRIIKLNHPGTQDPIFASTKVELVCNACKRNKNVDNCRHKLWALPSWKGKEKFELAKLIYEGVDREETRQRESLGLALTDSNLVFDQTQVEAFMKRSLFKYLRPTFQPTHLFMVVDPNAGSSGESHSHMAIVTLAYICDQLVVSLKSLFIVNLNLYTGDLENGFRIVSARFLVRIVDARVENVVATARVCKRIHVCASVQRSVHEFLEMQRQDVPGEREEAFLVDNIGTVRIPLRISIWALVRVNEPLQKGRDQDERCKENRVHGIADAHPLGDSLPRLPFSVSVDIGDDGAADVGP
jgi:hypothetical protein